MIGDLLNASMRFLMMLATLVAVVAIGLGRANPERLSRFVPTSPSFQILDHALTAPYGMEAMGIDLETGRLEPISLPPGLGIDKANLSPWEERGRRQLVGVGWNRSGSGESSRLTDLGLIRMTLPDGEILDRWILPNEALPVSPPCWISGVSTSVLYVGGDFRLYRIDFEPTGLNREAEDGHVREPRLLEWHAPTPGNGGVQVRDLNWPDGPCLSGRALASLRFRDPATGRYTEWQVWWLRLDRAATSIVAAGRLLEPSPVDAAISRRLPSLVGVRGEPALAYLAHRPDDSGYQLRVAPIRFDPATNAPHAEEPDARILASGCAPTRPVASVDGRWITIVRSGGPRIETERIAIPNGSGPGSAIRTEPAHLKLVPQASLVAPVTRDGPGITSMAGLSSEERRPDDAPSRR